jgi:hypothetical protein
MRLVSVVTSTRSPLALAQADLVQQVVDLSLHRAHLDDGVEQSGRANHLLDHHALGQLQLEFARRRRHVDQPRREREELVEHQRSVVERTRQAEP